MGMACVGFKKVGYRIRYFSTYFVKNKVDGAFLQCTIYYLPLRSSLSITIYNTKLSRFPFQMEGRERENELFLLCYGCRYLRFVVLLCIMHHVYVVSVAEVMCVFILGGGWSGTQQGNTFTIRFVPEIM